MTTAPLPRPTPRDAAARPALQPGTWLRAIGLTLALGAGSLAVAADAGVVVRHAWARPTVPGQPVGAAYFEITSPTAATLTAIESVAAGEVQLHRMDMDGDVMRMRRVERLELPAGQPVVLSAGGMHLMLMQLKRPLREGDRVPLLLTLRRAAPGKAGEGALQRLRIDVPVRAAPPKGAP